MQMMVEMGGESLICCSKMGKQNKQNGTPMTRMTFQRDRDGEDEDEGNEDKVIIVDLVSDCTFGVKSCGNLIKVFLTGFIELNTLFCNGVKVKNAHDINNTAGKISVNCFVLKGNYVKDDSDGLCLV